MRASYWAPDLNKYIGEFAMVIDDLDAAAVECVETGQQIQYDAMIANLEKHKDTGAALEALEKKSIIVEGNQVTANTGMYFSEGSPGFFHAQWQEYGSPTFKADPWLRPAIDNTKATIRRTWKGIVQRRVGVKLK